MNIITEVDWDLLRENLLLKPGLVPVQTKELMCLPIVKEMEQCPQGFSRREWVDRDGALWLFVVCRGPVFSHRALVFGRSQKYYPKLGVYETYYRLPNEFSR